MFIHRPNPLAPRGGKETPESVFRSRRRWLQLAGLGAVGIGAGWGYQQWHGYSSGADDDVLAAGRWTPEAERQYAEFYPAAKDRRFEYGRAETPAAEAARHTNFYEFSRFKWCWKYVGSFRPEEWTITIDGLCRRPLELDLAQFHRQFRADLVERQYRHRCVERWAMAVPWTGVPLAAVLKAADPLAQATHVRFVSFHRPAEAPQQADASEFPWPYTEGLTIAEATNDLTLLAVGIYGGPLPKQQGAPIRLVVPWKYGYKSIKSIQRIELIGRQPATFWNTLNPRAYPFESNVDPAVPRPWDQSYETMLGSGERVLTERYNGYERWVAGLY
ncbi:MAG: protein-methionine-sulfoxide reductase catalytic subunit MsrP [Planctomycetaceae bacterium]|nr:protein-methionine-sulfoxide reductase catalytic subunit MsrP [Planctomycetaceae bacterium]